MRKDKEFREVLKKWGSKKKLFAYCDEQVHRFLPLICGKNIPIPAFTIKPSTSFRAQVAGCYVPKTDKTSAVVALAVRSCFDRREIALTTAHELIHHWELCGANGAKQLAYPESIKKLISRVNPRKAWLCKHSDVFLAKACEVAILTEFSIVELVGLRFDWSRPVRGVLERAPSK